MGAGTEVRSNEAGWILGQNGTSNRIRASILACLAGLVGALSFADSAGAASAPQGPWILPPTVLSADWRSDNPQVDSGASDGTTTAVWDRYDGAYEVIQASVREPYGSFEEPVTLSATGEDSNSPQVATAPDGTTTVVWRRGFGVHYVIQAATRRPGGEFGAPEDLSVEALAEGPQVAVAPDGTTTVIWVRVNGSDDGTNRVVQARTRPPGGAFGPVENLSAPGQDAKKPQIAVAGNGATTVVWYRSNGSENIVQAASRPAGGNNWTVEDLSLPGRHAHDPQVAMSADGATAVVWARTNGTWFVVQGATRPAGGSGWTDHDLADPGGYSGNPQVAMAPDGAITATWYRNDGSHNIIQAASRPAEGGSWTPVSDISSPGQFANDPQVAAAADGTVTIVYRRDDAESDRIIWAATRRQNETSWQILSAPGRNANIPQVAVAPDGTTTAVWQRFNGDFNEIQQASTVPPPRPDPKPPIVNCGRATMKIKKVRKNRRKGIATVQVKVGTAGRLTLKGGKVRKVVRKAKKRGTYGLKVVTRGKAAKQLRRKGRLRVKVTISFKAAGCNNRKKSIRIKLVR